MRIFSPNIDDIVEGLLRCYYKSATINPNLDPHQHDHATEAAQQIFNIDNRKTKQVLHFIEEMEQTVVREAAKGFQPI